MSISEESYVGNVTRFLDLMTVHSSGTRMRLFRWPLGGIWPDWVLARLVWSWQGFRKEVVEELARRDLEFSKETRGDQVPGQVYIQGRVRGKERPHISVFLSGST